jgi:hypothetical protein
MAEVFKVVVPQSGLVSPSTWGSRAQIKKMLETIMSKYGDSIKKIGKMTNIPPEIIASFIAVESGGKADAGGAGHITQGLMQWNRSFAANFLEAEKRLGRLSNDEEELLKSYGITFTNGKTREITNADQLKPELNILIGSILLGQYIDSYFDGGKGGKNAKEWATQDGQIRLDRIIAVYNAGAYGDAGKKARNATYATAAEMAANVNPITRSYIQKMLGMNGAMDIMSNELSNLI